LFSVALALSAIPEGLPVALTVAMVIATAHMARRGVNVRRLAAVKGLGGCTLIGSDKTCTLTFAALPGLALTIFAAMDMHKWWWNIQPKWQEKKLTRPMTLLVVLLLPRYYSR
jgi:hypothetical protein